MINKYIKKHNGYVPSLLQVRYSDEEYDNLQIKHMFKYDQKRQQQLEVLVTENIRMDSLHNNDEFLVPHVQHYKNNQQITVPKATQKHKTNNAHLTYSQTRIQTQKAIDIKIPWKLQRKTL
ncbi:Hypothetical_protein [Hexamita inflata]|uniref:Hypothetical_protein n=1 Tax=Hexamita inflata TaxID=28002 RepID=A0AA86RRS3_9EUKA|nr:Hypothetical protein HINF_LOCUS59065 [Hexamita inflata]